MAHWKSLHAKNLQINEHNELMNTWDLLHRHEKPFEFIIYITISYVQAVFSCMILTWCSIFYLVRLHITYKLEGLPSTLPKS